MYLPSMTVCVSLCRGMSIGVRRKGFNRNNFMKNFRFRSTTAGRGRSPETDNDAGAKVKINAFHIAVRP